MDKELEKKRRKKGIIMVLAGAPLWGASGVAVQYLFNAKHVTPEWVLTVRMFVTAILFLAVDKFQGQDVFGFWKKPGNCKEMLIFSFFGSLGMQLPFFIAIDMSNAPTATVLQYLMPVIVLFWCLYKNKQKPSKTEILAVFLAILGTYLLATKGNWTSLAISSEGLFWGILSAFGMAIYTVYPKKLLAENSSMSVLGWSSFVTGIYLLVLTWPFPTKGILDWQTWSAFGVLVFLGTFVSYFLYLESTKYIKPYEVSSLAAVEPLSSLVLAILLLGVKFILIDLVGVACIITTVILLARQK